MPLYLPFVALFVWFGAGAAILTLGLKILGGVPEWQEEGFKNLILCLVGIAVGWGIVQVARRYFAGRAKGFGLDWRTIHKDFAAAALNLLCILPLVVAAWLATTHVGKWIWGPDFNMGEHQQLELVGQHSQWSIRILVLLVAVVVAPVLEELLFRGLFQSAMRSLLRDLGYRHAAWLSIAAGSLIFVMSHTDIAHWPALFMLSMGMGYSYEKSGSLLRPIFIHAFFNGINLVTVLLAAG